MTRDLYLNVLNRFVLNRCILMKRCTLVKKKNHKIYILSINKNIFGDIHIIYTLIKKIKNHKIYSLSINKNIFGDIHIIYKLVKTK